MGRHIYTHINMMHHQNYPKKPGAGFSAVGCNTGNHLCSREQRLGKKLACDLDNWRMVAVSRGAYCNGRVLGEGRFVADKKPVD